MKIQVATPAGPMWLTAESSADMIDQLKSQGLDPDQCFVEVMIPDEFADFLEAAE